MKYITFIIPSIGRDSLIKSVESIIAQSDSDWSIIIIFDGVYKNIDIIDSRIKYIEIEKTGNINKMNSAGLVRNIGFKYIEDSKWIGFLDDDDTISSDYIEKLKEEEKITPNIDLCIFRMTYKNGYVLPSEYERNIQRNKVGISFAIKSYVINNVQFTNNPFEDFIFLKEAQIKNYKIVISPYITYFIKHFLHSNIKKLYPRIILR
jgi:glycosyltransferase involved in cell wall biosynthesis